MTEDDLELPWRRTFMRQRRRIMRVRKRRRARALKELRIARRLTRLRTVEMPPATELILPKRLARALTPHHVSPTRPHLQRSGTRGKQIPLASHDGANAVTLVRRDRHGDVKAVD